MLQQTLLLIRLRERRLAVRAGTAGQVHAVVDHVGIAQSLPSAAEPGVTRRIDRVGAAGDFTEL